MAMRLSLLYFIIISVILIGVLGFNVFYLQNPQLNIILGLAYIIFYGWKFGILILPKETAGWRIFYGILFLLSAISFLGAIFYYFWNLSTPAIFTISACIAAILLLIFIIQKCRNKLEINIEINLPEKTNKISLVFSAIYLVLFYFAFRMLVESGTAQAIRSPWEVIPENFFIIYFLMTAALVGITLYNTKIWLSFILISIHALLSVSVALIVYRLGFGFDPFIHRATEEVILNKGAIYPKPLYYLGQYSLVVYLAKMFTLPVAWIDKLLIPALFSAYIPTTIYFAFKNFLENNRRIILFSALAFLAVPFGFFISTTPQGLANFYSLLIIFLSWLYINKRQIPFLALLFLGFATAAIHPLSGIPVLIFLGLVFLFTFFRKQKGLSALGQKIIIGIFIFISAVSMPLIFWLQSKLSENLQTVFRLPEVETINFYVLVLARKFDLFLDLFYTYAWSWRTVFFITALTGTYLFYKHYFNNRIKVYWIAYAIIIANYLLLKLFVNFGGLIYYEQGSYAGRLLDLSRYFLLPFTIYAVYNLYLYIRKSPLLLRIFFIFLPAAIITSSLYISYPRYDDYEPSRGWSVSGSDIKTVNFIDMAEENNDYIVLANQAVSSAALYEFGFKKYFKNKTGEYFYYPIPTGGELYNYYLDMVYNGAKRETMESAMALTGVNVAYFVVNDYWWQSAVIIEEAKGSADDWTKIDEGKIWVFKYIK